MSPPGRSLPEKKGRWKLLLGANWDDLPKSPHLEQDLEELERISKEVDSLISEKLRLLSESQGVTAKIRSLTRQGDRLRGRIGATLKGYLGFDAELLIAYGFKPRRSKERDPETERRAKEGASQKEEPERDSG